MRAILGFRHYERANNKVISRALFARRMAIAVSLWFALTLGGLIIGVAGYSYFESMSLPDAYVNAAMILSGVLFALFRNLF